jgi:hypothetical protein
MKQFFSMLKIVIVLSILNLATAFSNQTYTVTLLSMCTALGSPAADITPMGKTVCMGSLDSFQIVISNGTPPITLVILETYTDGTVSKTTQINGIMSSPYWFKVTPVRNTTYSVQSVTDATGSSNPGNGYVTFNTVAPPKLDIGPDKMVCATSRQTLSSPPGFDSWQWSTGEVTSSITITPMVNTQIMLTAKSITAPYCVVKDTLALAVFAMPTVSFVNDSVDICDGNIYTMNPTVSADVVKYTWTPAVGLSSSTLKNPVFNSSIGRTYSLKVENGLCSATAEQTITVNLNPTLMITGIDQPACEGTPVSINVFSDVVGTTFTFYPATGLSNPTISNPVATLDTTTQYTIEAITDKGCKNFKPITVNITKKPVADFSYQVYGGRVVFTSTSKYASAYDWDFGDDTTSIEENPIHDYTVYGSKFNVWLTVANTCGTSTKNRLVTGVKVGLDELEAGKVSLYPNPVVDYITIEGIQKVSVIQIFGANGGLVTSKQFNNESSVTIDVSNFAYGQYLINFILVDGSNFSKKFVKQ